MTGEGAVITEPDMARALAEGAAAFRHRSSANPYSHPLLRWAWELGWRLAVELDEARVAEKQRDAGWFKTFSKGATP